MTQFRFSGLAIEPFRPLFDLDDEALAARAMRRVVAGAKPGAPCRVTLLDAEIGERLILLPFEHQPVSSPYRASGAIFVREAAAKSYDDVAVPEVVRARLVSLRAYDEAGMMVDAEVVEGAAVEPVLARLFARDDTAYLHVHNARRGCYACRVDRQ